MSTPIVSVVMPVYNSIRYLDQAVDSILGQTFADLELIAVDDGSTDGSRAALAERSARDGRVRLIEQDHRGVTVALNAGLRAVRGQFIARMDADDISAPYRFERQLAFLEAHREVVAVGSAVLQIDPEGLPIAVSKRAEDHESLVEELSHGRGGLAHPTAMIRREAMEACGGYDERFAVGQDKPLWMALSKQGRLANMPDVLLCYRRHLKSITATRPDMPLRTALRSGRVDADHYADWARRAILHGYGVTARKYARQVMRCQPWQPRSWWLLGRSLTLSAGSSASSEGFML